MIRESLPAIRQAVRDATGGAVDAAPEPVGGGCIHEAFRLGSFFVKTNRPQCLAMFEAEADGLRAIAATGTVRVPEPVVCGADAHAAFLVMEWLDLGGLGDEARLGADLAAMHLQMGDSFGWPRDNFIGSTPQDNTRSEKWADFFRDRRLAPMFRRLADNGSSVAGAERLLERLPELLDGVNARPCLLHGDLWGGNAGFLRDGTPVVFDPAVYHGHHETDLAMTRLFGGFGPRFYHGYHEVVPTEPGSEERERLYNLYHILNHALLFGGGYHAQAAAAVRALA
jgi:fructosamine-3-kinase